MIGMMSSTYIQFLQKLIDLFLLGELLNLTSVDNYKLGVKNYRNSF